MHGMVVALVLALIAVGAVVFTLLSPWWFTPLASNWGAIDRTLIITIIITGIAFIAVNLFVAYTVVRYRQRQGARASFITEHPVLEWSLIGITVVGIVVLLAPGLFSYSRFIHAPEDAMALEVVGEQFRWTFRFPGPDGELGRADPKLISLQNPYGLDPADPKGRDDVLIQASEVHLPIARPVRLQLRAKDVIHSFYVPQFRVKMDAVPGMVTHVWFTPTKRGRYEIACAEFCGIGHYAMRGVVIVEGESTFENWLEEQPTFAELYGGE